MPCPKSHNSLRHGQLQNGGMALLNTLERAHQPLRKLQPSRSLCLPQGSPGRACTLHLKEKCSHLGRTDHQASWGSPPPPHV